MDKKELIEKIATEEAVRLGFHRNDKAAIDVCKSTPERMIQAINDAGFAIVPREISVEAKSAIFNSLQDGVAELIDRENGDDRGTFAKASAWNFVTKSWPAMLEAGEVK